MIIDWDCEEARGCDWAMVNTSKSLIEFNKEKSVLGGNGFYDNEYLAERWEQHERPKAEQITNIHSNGLIYGVGINDCTSGECSKKQKKSYSTWSGMLERCYSSKSQAVNPTYIGCKVSDSWLRYSNFKRWYDINYIDGMHLDKDLVKIGNKTYCEEYCRFVPREINNLLTCIKIKNNGNPPGVYVDKKTFRAMMTVRGRQVSLGNFNTKAEAFAMYKKTKELHVKEVASEYFDNGLIDASVLNSLLSWSIDFDTRTVKEKAIDDINYILMNEVAGKTTRQIAEHIVNKLEYITFTGDK